MFIIVTTADAADHGTTCFKKSSQFFLHFICEGKTQHITFITCKIQERVIITCGIFLLFEKKQLSIKPFIILI